MSFRWSPLPHVALEGDGFTELALNAVLYVLTVSIGATLGWLGTLAWADRER